MRIKIPYGKTTDVVEASNIAEEEVRKIVNKSGKYPDIRIRCLVRRARDGWDFSIPVYLYMRAYDAGVKTVMESNADLLEVTLCLC